MQRAQEAETIDSLLSFRLDESFSCSRSRHPLATCQRKKWPSPELAGDAACPVLSMREENILSNKYPQSA